MKKRNLLIVATIMGAMSAAAWAYGNTAITRDFVHKASVANEFEIESSQVALDRSRDEAVRKFAQRMIDDHTQTGEKLKEVLQSSQSQLQPADALDGKHQRLLDKLKNSSPHRFDRWYISMQTDAHKDAVRLFSDYSRHGRDPALRDFASETLPALQDHLHHVRQLKPRR
jgi:putative membrane protein